MRSCVGEPRRPRRTPQSYWANCAGERTSTRERNCPVQPAASMGTTVILSAPKAWQSVYAHFGRRAARVTGWVGRAPLPAVVRRTSVSSRPASKSAAYRCARFQRTVRRALIASAVTPAACSARTMCGLPLAVRAAPSGTGTPQDVLRGRVFGRCRRRFRQPDPPVRRIGRSCGVARAGPGIGRVPREPCSDARPVRRR